jgi:GTPase Era involved in 16S rRNA processing
VLPEECRALLDELERLQRRFSEAEDREAADKTAELAGKLREGRIAVAFSGHFSAGKSSLINKLCGKPLLPSGPIPTSANLVRIARGEEEAAFVTDRDGTKRISFEQLAEACKDGASFPRIEIRTAGGIVGGGLDLLDTPGVDSTDDAHRKATEASLYLADAVFFVTDYNHVLSETNLFFLRKLEDMGKPYAVLVNQVDKHRPGEMPFGDYRNHVEQTLSDWQLKPFAVLYVSVKSPDHPLSEWNRFLRLLEGLKTHAPEIAAVGVSRAMTELIRQHAERAYPLDEPEGDAADGTDGRAGAESAFAEACGRLAEVRRRQDEIRKEPEAKREAFLAELGKLIDNAQLMTADVRDLAGAYLESRKPGFKVGLFFAEAKTREERANRLAAFKGKLAEHVESRLVWHLNQLLGPHFATELTEEELAEAVREGAVLSDAYTLTYCQMLENEIKGRYRRKATQVYDETVLAENRREADARLAGMAEEAAAAEEAIGKAERRLAAWRDREALVLALSEPFRATADRPALPEGFAGLPDAVSFGLKDRADDGQESRKTVLPEEGGTGQTAHGDAMPQMPERSVFAPTAGPRPEGAVPGLTADGTSALAGNETASANRGGGPEADVFRYRSILEQAADRLAAAADLLRDVPALEAERDSLAKRAEKLRNNRFTVALFGAFSAGKSSFANALFGMNILPVSPNPTTAAINAVLPPNPDHPHGTAVIRMKTEAELSDDLRHSLSMLGASPEGVTTPEQALAAMERALQGAFPPRGRAHVSFIQAAAKGHAAVREKLGSSWRADLETYRQYVAEEEKSCFVKSIDLFLDSPLAGQGVVLVDTPGADSVHARHTGVTFNYIRQADAILFVTYYNHAFSRADRQFLEQLGRVKDAFELDRMFFLVNAADLADSEEELGQVLDYVGKELVRHGIRNPRLFPVSSREALEAKQAGDGHRLGRSGFPAFETAFARFASGELADTLLRAADLELVRIHGRIRRLADQHRADAGERRKRAEAIRREAPDLLRGWREETALHGAERIRRELGELVHHVKKRCLFRFGGLFADAFHPSVLREDVRDIGIALTSAWNELVQAVTTDVAGEMLATGLRMEQFVTRELLAWRKQAAERLQDAFPEWTEGAWEPPAAGMPELEEGLDPEPVSASQLSRRFRNAKTFFEGGGRDAMREWLESLLMDAASRYADRMAETLSGYYVSRFGHLLEEADGGLRDELERFARAYADDAAGGTTVDWEALADRFGLIAGDKRPEAVAAD